MARRSLRGGECWFLFWLLCIRPVCFVAFASFNIFALTYQKKKILCCAQKTSTSLSSAELKLYKEQPQDLVNLVKNF